MADPAIPEPGLSGQIVRGVVDQPGQPEAVATATPHGLLETIRQAGDFALAALDKTGEALGKAVDVVSDKAFEEAANVGVNIATPKAEALAQSTFSWGGYFQALGLMCILLAGLWFAVWAIRRYGKFNFLPRPGSLPKNSLVMEAQMPLGPRKGLMVVRFMKRRLLLGVTDHQITLLTEDNAQDEQQESNFDGYLENAANSRVRHPPA